MDATACTSFASHRRTARARAWLMARAPAEELLIIGANLDAANELARPVAQTTGGAFVMAPIYAGATRRSPRRATHGCARHRARRPARRRSHCMSRGARTEPRRCSRSLLPRRPDSPAPSPACSPSYDWLLLALRVLGKVAPDLLLLLRAYEAELAEGKFTD
jgi:hypothetical protein